MRNINLKSSLFIISGTALFGIGVAVGSQFHKNSLGSVLEPQLVGAKWRYSNLAGGGLNSMEFEKASVFTEGLASVERGSSWGFVDYTGAFAVSPQFDESRGFQSGVAAVRIGNQWGLIE